jgi:putative toxin-antitoxin system antitoxin component (TIGR02293 family)
MSMPKTNVFHSRREATYAFRGVRTLGIRGNDAMQIVRQVQAGFPFSRLARLQKFTQLPWEKLARFVSIPKRTLTRRQNQGRLQPEESDRVLRASAIFDMAVELFEGDVAGARGWLERPQPGLGGEIPLELAATSVGAKEVENLIGCLEYGLFV